MNDRPWVKHYDSGVPADLAWDGLTLPEILARTTVKHGDRPALKFVNRVMSYREFELHVARFAAGLVDLGLQKGDRVAIHLPNLPQTVVSFYGTLAAGGVAVMTNPLYVEREIEAQWNDAGCSIAVTADFLFQSHIASIRGKLPVREYVIASIPEYLRFPLNLLAPLKLARQQPPAIARIPQDPGIRRFASLVAPRVRPTLSLGERMRELALTGDDLALLQYTGGTTGRSKGAMLTHANIASNTQQTAAWFPRAVPGGEVFLGALPFFHVFGLTVGMNFPIAIGAENVVIPNPRDIRGLVESIERDHISIFPVVPSLIRAISNHPRIETKDLSSIKICVSGSAPLPEAVLRRFEEMTGGKIIEGFGLTEASPVTHCNPVDGSRRVNSIGLPFSGTECRIVSADDDRKDMPVNEPGELLLRGPQVMKGYWNQPEETAATLHDGWLHTGDLATRDDEGYFRIVGRKKEMIVAGGYKIYPDEVDRVLAMHPAVADSATIGVPDEKRGETVKSFVVLHPGATVETTELTQYCHERLAAYKVPKQIEVRSELPKSSALKVLRRQLLQEELEKRSRTGAAAER